MAFVLHAKSVITMNPRAPAAEAVAVRDGRIAEVGSLPEVTAAAGEGAERVDLGDAAVLPAFIDAHHHYSLAAFDRRTPDLHMEPGASVEDLLEQVEKAAASGGDGWLRLQGYDPSKLRERRAPTAAEIDSVCPKRPVLLIAYSFHDGCLNSPGLAEMGWDRNSTDPPHGVLARDRRGELTGEVSEAALFLAEARSRGSLLARGEDAWMAECEEHGESLLAAGIARVGDPTVPPAFERLYERAAADGRLPLTVHRMPVGEATVLEPRFEGDPTGAGPAQAPVGPVKIFVDGAERCAVCLSMTQVARAAARTLRAAVGGEGLAAIRAARNSPKLRFHRDGLLHGGELFWAQEPLDAAVSTAAERGFQVAQHAIGNEAIERAVTAIERSGAALDRAPGRPRLEHVMLLDEPMCRRIAATGAIAVVQPFLIYDTVGDVMALTPLPPPLIVKPLRSLLDAGVTLAGSSDHPVSDFDVLAGIRAAVTRATRGGRVCEPEQAITVDDALRAYTLGSAKALGVAHEAGSLEPGKRADIVVLSRDPRLVDPDDYAGISVLRTYVAGRLAYRP
ncbi:MAG: hypothetical protein QOH76_2275 [Thermoleophilaceae bacterium]|jgi:predicted amidohydrolase YtcJ|nr:hypothetical protein [Thermoleophilaceae bacterium]